MPWIRAYPQINNPLAARGRQSTKHDPQKLEPLNSSYIMGVINIDTYNAEIKRWYDSGGTQL
jgi:hypothetical protein